LSLVFCSRIFAATYYVSATDGNDSGTGLATTPYSAGVTACPWKTIAKANAQTYAAGDKILFKRGDLWREKLTMPSGGNAGNPIVLSNYGTGNKPAILGSEAALNWTDQGGNIWQSATPLNQPWDNSGGYPANVFFVNPDLTVATGVTVSSMALLKDDHDWFWQSNAIYVYSATDPGAKYHSVEVTQRDICMQLNKKSYLTVDGIDTFYAIAGVHAGQSVPTLEQHGITVRNCESAYHGYPDCGGYGLSISASDSLLENNEVHDCGRRGVSIGLFASATTFVTISNITIQHNHFYHGYHTTSVDCQADSGIGLIDHVYIKNNLIEEDHNYNPVASPMLLFVSQQAGAGATISNIYVTGNVFKYSFLPAMNLDKVTGMFIYNNTFYGHNEVENNPGFIFIGGCTGVKAKNNIFYSQLTYDTNSAGLAWYLTSANQYADIESDYNLYSRTSPTLAIIRSLSPSAIYTSANAATIRSAFGWEMHSKFVDPQVKSAADLSLQATSPAINAGTDVGLTTDYAGHAIVGLPDIGAYEYIPPTTATPTPSPTPTVTMTATAVNGTATATVTATSVLAGLDLQGKTVLAFPNPAVNQVQFLVRLVEPAEVKIMLYNVSGRLVAQLRENLPAGQGPTLAWDCRQAAAGVYVAQVAINGKAEETIKIAVVGK
jgi:hypothetical protein